MLLLTSARQIARTSRKANFSNVQGTHVSRRDLEIAAIHDTNGWLLAFWFAQSEAVTCKRLPLQHICARTDCLSHRIRMHMDKHGVSPQNRKLGLHFANAVTVPVPCGRPSKRTIARSGKHSVFELFTRCFRRSTRDNSRSGLSLIEMNKELEKQGFTRVRIRPASKPHQQHHGTAPSSFRYSSRRWRDPDDIHDLLYLQAVWPAVNKDAKVPCPLEVVIACLRDAVEESAQHDSEKVKGKNRRHVSLSPTETKKELVSLFQDGLEQGAEESGSGTQKLITAPTGQKIPECSPVKSALTFTSGACGEFNASKQHHVVVASPAPSDIGESPSPSDFGTDPFPSVLLYDEEGPVSWNSMEEDLERLVAAQDEDIETLMLAVSEPWTDLSSEGVMSMLSDSPTAPLSL